MNERMGMNGNGSGARVALRNHVAIVLDESGSMETLRPEAIDAFNQQVETIRQAAEGQETTVSLVKFNTAVPDPVYWMQPVDRMAPIGPADYEPNGLTAMLDAVGLTIDRLKQAPGADDEDTSFLVLIISDGLENNSKRYTYESVAERIQELDGTDRWTFTYLGANQNLSVVSQRMNIPMQNVSVFAASPEGLQYGAERMRTGSEFFFQGRRAGRKSSKAFFDASSGPGQQPGAKEGDGSSWEA